MANHKSAKKRIRRNEKFQLINKIRKTRVRTFIKKVESFIEKKDKTKCKWLLLKLNQRRICYKIMKKNTITKLSRLSIKSIINKH